MNRAQRLARLLRVLAAVVAEPGLNPIELADRVGVSERTLRRDLAELREMGYEVAYTSGYEVQEKLNLDGRTARKKAKSQDQELLEAVAQALGTIGFAATAKNTAEPRQRRQEAPGKPLSAGPAPIVLIPTGEADPDFIHATGFSVETGLYIRYPDGDDVLVVSPLEFDRARAQSSARHVVEDRKAYATQAWAQLAASMLQQKGFDAARVLPHLHAVQLEAMRRAGLAAEVDGALFADERRRKSADQAGAIRQSQQAAEAAVVEVVRELAQAKIRDGLLWAGEVPMTSEHLYARAQMRLGEMGFTCPDMIIAGSPNSALPHFRGEGQLAAHAPVIIDIFPISRTTHFHGDLTRTVVVGEVPDEFRRMHAAVVQALDAGEETIRAGVTGREVHSNVCQVLVDRGYGTTSAGFEGPDGVPKMNHSTGHGVGLEVHEAPSLRETNTAALHEGDVVTVEPGLYKLGLGGVRVEDTGLVTANGFDNFTTLTRSLDPRDYL